MDAVERSAAHWFRFAQIGSILLLGALVAAGIYSLRILQSEGARFPVMLLAGGLLFIAIQLWAIFFLLFMAVLDPQRRPQAPQATLDVR